MITLPMLGAAAPMWWQRTAGTLTGGLLGWGLLAAAPACKPYLATMAVLLAGVGHAIGEHAGGLSYFGKLFSLTAVLVLLAPPPPEPELTVRRRAMRLGSPARAAGGSAAFAPLLNIFPACTVPCPQVPVSRMIGVACGCALSALVSTLVLPMAASRASLLHLRASLAALTMLSSSAWSGYSAALGSLAADGAAPPGCELPGLPAGGAHGKQPPGGLQRRSAVPDGEQQEVDARLDAVLAALRRADACAAAAKNEVFLGRLLRGRLLLFLPAPPAWLHHAPRPLAPHAAVADVMAACRACCRVLWMLHSALAPGFPPRQLAQLAGLHGLERLQSLTTVADAALQRCLEHMDAALAAMEGRQHSGKTGNAGALEEVGACSDPASAAAAAVAELSGSVAALVGASLANREALRHVLEVRQVAAEQQQTAGSPAATAADDRQEAGDGRCAGAPAPTSDTAAPAPALPPAVQPGWHDLAGEGVHSLLRWHTVAFLLEHLAQRSAQLQRAVAALAAALPI